MLNIYTRKTFVPDDGATAIAAMPTTPEPSMTGDDDMERRLDKMVDEGEGTKPVTEPAPDAQTQAQAQTTTPPATPSTLPDGTQPAQVDPNKPADAQTQPPQEAALPVGPQGQLTVAQRMRSDDKGNLVNEQGHIVAKAGKERRLWERVQRLEHQDLPAIAQQYQTLNQELADANVLNKVPQQLGLTNEESLQGLKLMASYKKDPLATAKYILTEVKAAGHNIEELGSGLDIGAISSLIDQRLAPLLQSHQQQSAQDEVTAQARTQATQFFNAYPDATVHEDVIANLLTRDANMSPDVAYYQLKLWATQNGFDWTKPLQPQVLVKQQGVQGQQPQAPNPNLTQPNGLDANGATPPMGGGRVANAPTTDMTRNAASSNGDAETGDIVREAMREAGFAI